MELADEDSVVGEDIDVVLGELELTLLLDADEPLLLLAELDDADELDALLAELAEDSDEKELDELKSYPSTSSTAPSDSDALKETDRHDPSTSDVLESYG